MWRNYRMVNLNKEMKWFLKQLLRLKLDLLVIHFSTEIAGSCLVSRNDIDVQLAALVLLSYYRKGTGIIEHVC